MNANQIKFRCSSLGHLMTEPIGKSNMQKWDDAKEYAAKLAAEYHQLANKETKTAAKLLERMEKATKEAIELHKTKDVVNLSESTKTHLVDVFVSNKYGRTTEIENKYVSKGLAVEEDSITLFSRVKKTFFKKNEDHLANDFIQGTPDIFIGDSVHSAEVVIDIKSSWDIFTFFRVQSKDINKLYYWQLQGYMALTGAKSAKLVYCLVNTPEIMINDEKRKLMWKMGAIDENEITDEAFAELEKNMIYDDIPMDERVFEIPVERNDDDIKRLYKRIEESRTWMNENLFKTNLIEA